jgi:hypothetical protein
MTCLESTKVAVLANCLVSENMHNYKMQGKVEHYHKIVPLWKGHEVGLLDKNFVDEYARMVQMVNVHNTGKMDKVDSKVPSIHFQITGVCMRN